MGSKVSEKNTGLCLIRILAAFLVVCFHFHSNWEYYPRPYIFLRELAVSMFLIMSFYLGKKTVFSFDTDKQKKKLKRQLVPYLFWGIAAWLYMFIAGNLLNLTEHVTAGNLIWQVLTGCVENVNPPLWYLWQSMALMLLFVLIYRIFKEKASLIILFCLLIICYVLQYTGINFNFFSGQRYEIKNMLGRTAEVLPMAAAGIFMAKADIMNHAFKKRKLLIPLLFVVLFIFIGFHDNIFPYPETTLAYSGIAHIIVTPLILTFFYILPFEKLPYGLKNGVDAFSKYMIGIICVHWFFGKTINVLYLRLTGEEHTLTECFIIFFASWLLCFLIGKLPHSFFKEFVT